MRFKSKGQIQFQRIIATIFFVITVACGMQIATQRIGHAQANTTATPPPTPTATMTGAGSSDAATNSTPAPNPPAATSLSTSLSNLLPNTIDPVKILSDQIEAASGNGPTKPGAPGIGTPGAAQATGATSTPSPSPAASPPTAAPKTEVFVPSEVERYIPGSDRVGDPRAILHTSLGDIRIRLYPDQAPRTVKNFIDLARGDRDFVDARTSKHTRRPFYSDLIFHRVLPPYLIQTGCPFGTGRGGPGYTIPDEFSRNLAFEKAGMVAMASERDAKGFVKNSNGSQFFITLQPMPAWTGAFTIFGEVEHGMEVVHKIAAVRTGPTDRPIRKVYLRQVEIIDEATAKLLPNAAASDGAQH